MEASAKPCFRAWTGLFFWSVFFLFSVCGQELGALVVSGAVAGTDDIPPAPAELIRADDYPGDGGGRIQVSWRLSPDDEVSFTSFVPGGYTAGAGGQGIVVGRRGILGYRIYRSRADEPPVLVSEVAAGIDRYLDEEVENGVLYVYEVRAFDAVHETRPEIEPGSPADLARRARAVDDSTEPVDAEGRPVVGWFDPDDDTVDFNDFFLFADHFGQVEGESSFDERFDLNGDYRVDFDDFFLFADHFGQVVANYEAVAGQRGP